MYIIIFESVLSYLIDFRGYVLLLSKNPHLFSDVTTASTIAECSDYDHVVQTE